VTVQNRVLSLSCKLKHAMGYNCTWARHMRAEQWLGARAVRESAARLCRVGRAQEQEQDTLVTLFRAMRPGGSKEWRNFQLVSWFS